MVTANLDQIQFYLPEDELDVINKASTSLAVLLF